VGGSSLGCESEAQRFAYNPFHRATHDPQKELIRVVRAASRSTTMKMVKLRTVDSGLRRVKPPDGLMLNTKIAEILGALPGSMITVEVLEGARPVRRVLLTAVVDEPVGLRAYMNLAALHHLMREGATTSGPICRSIP